MDSVQLSQELSNSQDILAISSSKQELSLLPAEKTDLTYELMVNDNVSKRSVAISSSLLGIDSNGARHGRTVITKLMITNTRLDCSPLASNFKSRNPSTNLINIESSCNTYLSLCAPKTAGNFHEQCAKKCLETPQYTKETALNACLDGCKLAICQQRDPIRTVTDLQNLISTLRLQMANLQLQLTTCKMGK